MLKRISAIVLGALMLVVNMSLTFSTHYCGGKAVDTSISLGKAEVGCGMEENSNEDCDTPLNEVTISKNCCENVYKTLSLDEDYKENSAQEVVNFNLNAAAIPNVLNISNNYICLTVGNTLYSPPLVKRDLTVIHQVFRI